jgi:hypothetical protein
MFKGRSETLVEIDSAKDLAIEHLFERSSVVRELHAAGMLLRRGIGRVSVVHTSLLASGTGNMRFRACLLALTISPKLQKRQRARGCQEKPSYMKTREGRAEK